MTSKNLDKALDIVSVLITKGEILGNGEHISLYDEYISGGEVYDMVITIIKKLNLNIYDYNGNIYLAPGENNKIFGYTNEELRKKIGVRLNRELYLCYFVIYCVMTRFYKDSDNYTFVEYIKIEEVIEAVDTILTKTVGELSVLDISQIEENSFREISLVWEDMPMVITDEAGLRAGRSSKAGIVKLVMNFMLSEELLLETGGKYYPKDRFRALIENYFNEYKGRIYEILKGGREDATY